MASQLPHKHLMKQKRVYLSLSGDEKPLYHVTLVLDINECDTLHQCLLVSVTSKYQYSWMTNTSFAIA